MYVEVGPVSSASVVAWCDYAQSALDGFGRRSRRLELPDGIGPRFDELLGEWGALAAKGSDFKWASDISLEEIEYLANALRGAAAHLAMGIERGELPKLPRQAEEFYDALVTGLLNAMSTAGGAASQFAEWLRSDWPGEAGRRLK